MENLFQADTANAGADFVAGEGEGEVNKNLGYRRINRIILRAISSNPDDARLMASTVASVLQQDLEAVAVRKAVSQRRMIENYIKITSKKISNAQKELQRAANSEPERILEQRERLQMLEKFERTTIASISELERQLDPESSIKRTHQSAAGEAVQKLEEKLKIARMRLMPTSTHLLRLQEQLNAVQAFANKLEEERQARDSASLRAQLVQKTRVLAQSQAEIKAISKVIPSERRQVWFSTRERELASWETELLSWEQKLLQTRIEERLCRGDGTAVLLQSPQRGVSSFGGATDLLQLYSRSLKLMPFVPLVWLILLLCWQVLQETRQVRNRAEFYFDAPVLGHISSLPDGGRSHYPQN